MLGVVAAVGLGAGAALAGSPSAAHQDASHEAISEANQLYQRELALNAENGHLGTILEADRARTAAAASSPTTSIPTGPAQGVQFQLVTAPAPPAVAAPASTVRAGAGSVAPASVRGSAETDEPSQAPATTTTTVQVSTVTTVPAATPTTTTVPVSTTTTTRPLHGTDD